MKIILTLISSCFISLAAAGQNNPNAILGKWMTVQNNLEVEVYKQDNDFKAKIVWFKDTDDKSRPMADRRDEKNPDPKLRSRKWIGMEVLRGMKYYPHDNEWADGTIYDAKSGKEWSSVAWL